MDNNLDLHKAIVASDKENFYRLLHHPDVDINYINDAGETPLMASIKKDFGSSMAMNLIKAGCDVNCTSQNGDTPLHLAAANDLIDVAHELILRGADVNSRAGPAYNWGDLLYDRYSPLNKAIENGNLETVCLLLYYQADVNIPVINGTHLMNAIKINQNNISEVLLNYSDNVDLSNSDWYGRTALSIAAEEKNPIAIDLVKRGADVNCFDCSFNFPLYSALWHDDNELFKLILPKFQYSYYDDSILLTENEAILKCFINGCKFSNSQWLECFYLILQSPCAFDFIREYEDLNQEIILWNIMDVLVFKNIKPKDRISIIYTCLSLGSEMKTDHLQYTYLLFGSNDEFEAVVYAGDLSYSDYKKQIRLLFKEPFNSAIPGTLYKKLSDPNMYDKRSELYRKFARVYIYKKISDYPTPSKKMFCSLGFYAMLLEDRNHYLAWITTRMPKQCEEMLKKLEKIPQFPSLLELSRDRVQKCIEEQFNIVKAYQFYDSVKSLKLIPVIEDIILFKQPIY